MWTGREQKLYKVLLRIDGKLMSPYFGMEYLPGEVYTCENFDESALKESSFGFYATGIDGLPYAFRNLPGYEVWECGAGGRRARFDEFFRRYEHIRLLRHVPNDEVRQLALEKKRRVGYNLAEVLFPVNPCEIDAPEVTPEIIDLAKTWHDVRGSVLHNVWPNAHDNVHLSVRHSMLDSIWCLVRDEAGNCVHSVWDSVWKGVRNSAWGNDWEKLDSPGICVANCVWGSVEDSVWAYISSLFPGVEQWHGIDHPEGTNPFQAGIDLWRMGFVVTFDGKIMRLHDVKRGKVVWEAEEI